MTTGKDSPASGAAPDPRSGAGTTTPTPEQGAPEAGGPEGRGRDYVERIRTDPDFAWEQVQTHQRNATKAGEDLRGLQRRLGPLAETLERGVTGEVLVKVIEEYQALANDPTIAQALQGYRTTGQVSLPSTRAQETPVQEDDLYVTDTERALKEQLDTMNRRFDQLTQQLSQQSTNLGVQSLSRHLENVFTEYEIRNPELSQKVRDTITQQVRDWSSAGEAGARAIAELQGAEGQKTVELLVLKALGKDGLFDVARERFSRESNARAELSTDGPSVLGTTGDEPGVKEHSRVIDAIQEARARPEVLGSR